MKLERVSSTVCTLVAGIMLGYGWAFYHYSKIPPKIKTVYYEKIAFEIPTKKKYSRKYLTHREYIWDNKIGSYVKN